MGRKVFLSILGTGFYSKESYISDCTFEEKESNKHNKDSEKHPFISSETRFIQEATIEYLGVQNWSHDDKLFICVTDKAKSLNWDKDIKSRKKTSSEEEYIGLENILINKNLPVNTEIIEILDGKNEKEIWTTFERIYEVLEEGDELYLDVTFGFRYLPMLLVVLMNYAYFLKKTIVRSITYGNVEAKKEGKSPIMDLLPLYSLQQWTNAAGSYIKTGNVDLLKQLGLENIKPILSQSKGKDENASHIRNLLNQLTELVDGISTCRGRNLSESDTTTYLKDNLTTISTTFIKAFNYIIDKIREDFDYFDSSQSLNNCYYAAKWCRDKELYQQAATFLVEFLFMSFFKKYNLNPQESDTVRKKVTEVIYTYTNVLDQEKNILKHKENVNKIQNLLRTIENTKNPLFKDPQLNNITFCRNFAQLIDHRNDFLHCGFRWEVKPKTPKKLKEDIDTYLDFFDPTREDQLESNMLNSIKNLRDYLVSKSLLETTHGLFLNYSNHPMEKWSKEQLDACSSFDMNLERKFPVVEDAGDEYYIQELVEEELVQIKELFGKINPSDVTIHIMGEMTFTYAMVNALKAEGYKCVASTTKRNTIELEDGTKQSTFTFNKFREYR